AFDKSGKYVKTIGRSGQGPGELGGAIAMTLLPDKNEIYVYEVSNRMISVFSTSGSYLRQIPVRGMTNDLKIDSRGNVFMMDFVRDTRLKPGLRQKVLKKMNPDMSKVLIEFTRYYLEENGKALSPVDYWVVDDKDHLIYGAAKTYEISYFNSDGKLARKILRDYAPVKVTQRDIDEFRKTAVPPGGPPGESRAYRYSPYHSAYRSFFIDDREHLFIQTWQRSDDNRKDIHDIFDADGRFIGQVPLPRNASLFNPRIRIMRNVKLYTIEPDEEGCEVVKRYAVTWLKE
ncbi:MAG: 6-bladed beta-propeller, partial [Candidatus Aminicenantes bacterium]|nr:6-bladed beta-propeller [Candidatus Aminicenantes bacterium]